MNPRGIKMTVGKAKNCAGRVEMPVGGTENSVSEVEASVGGIG